jgi:electron transport complex protein RnfD
MIGAFFMATDYATTPVTTKGKIIFGIGCGIITFVIRQFGNYPEGVSFSILLMNLLTPYIDRITKTSPLGAKPLVKEAK